MLKNHLTEIQGRLLCHFVEMYKDMNSDSTGTDWGEFYEEIRHCIKEIQAISSVSDLDRFCEEWGQNDLNSEFAFHNLAKEYLEIKEPA